MTKLMDKLTIARVVLHSDKRKMLIIDGSLKGSGFQAHLKHSYGQKLDAYQARIAGIAGHCSALEPDITLFPACAAIWERRSRLLAYRKIMTDLNTVLIGCLGLEPTFQENSEVLHKGRLLQRFDANLPVAIQLGGIASVVAQSSTIKAAYQIPTLTMTAKKHPAEPPYRLALDLGHGQYHCCYRRVLKSLAAQGMTTILSFWRNQDGKTKYPWIETARYFDLTRTKLAHGDFVDLITIRKKGKAT